MKGLLQEAWPHLLTKKIKPEDTTIVPSGCVHLLAITSSEGLKCESLLRSETIERIVFLNAQQIEELTSDVLFKVRT